MAGVPVPLIPSLPSEGFPASLLVGALSVPLFFAVRWLLLLKLARYIVAHCQGLDRRQKPDKRE
jgi:hypothetical protein